MSLPIRPATTQEMARRGTDWILFVTIVAMVGFGLVMLFSASSTEFALRFRVEPHHLVARQFVWALVSLIAMMNLKHQDYRQFNSPAWAFSALGVVLTLVLAGWVLDSATHRWLRLPGGTLNPSEFAKPAMILFLAYFLSQRAQIINDRRSLAQVSLAVLVMVALVVRANVATALIPALMAVIVLWVAGLEKRYMIRAMLMFLLLSLIALISRGYRVGRVMAYVDPDYSLIEKIDKRHFVRAYVKSSSISGDASYQGRQSRIAIGTGGISGVGLMQGRMKLLFLPDAERNFIYATVGEELGLWGSGAVLLGYIVILWRGVRLFLLARDDFGRYLALGVTVSIVLQALINISVVLDMVPSNGVPLPMISLGGSALLSELVSLGILLSVAEHEA